MNFNISLLLLYVFYITIAVVEIRIMNNSGRKKDIVLYIILFLIASFISTCYLLGIKLPSPSYAIEDFVFTIIGRR